MKQSSTVHKCTNPYVLQPIGETQWWPFGGFSAWGNRTSIGSRLNPCQCHICKMWLCHWEPLGVSESCRTRIPGWSNCRVDWSDPLAFRWTWEHLTAPATGRGAPMTSLGAQATSLSAPQITVEKSGRNNIYFGCTAGAPGNHSYYLSFNNF